MISNQVRLLSKTSPNNSSYNYVYPRLEEIFPAGRQTLIIGSFDEDGLIIQVPSLNLKQEYTSYIGNPSNLPQETYLKKVGEEVLDQRCFYQDYTPVLQEDLRKAEKELENLLHQESIVSAFIHGSETLITKQESPILYPTRKQFKKLENFLKKESDIIGDRDLQGYTILSCFFDEAASIIPYFYNNYASLLGGLPLDFLKEIPPCQEQVNKLVSSLYDISSEKLSVVKNTLNLVSEVLENK
ncbi:MAG TPA: hypothetical protein PLK34_02420 [Candidatus Pacearchaeota archaeon]|nr:hypothetical protein [Candidatus Pacearchaeota archaeon]